MIFFFLQRCIIHENQSEWEAFKIISQDVVDHRRQYSIFNVVVGANWSLYGMREGLLLQGRRGPGTV